MNSRAPHRGQVDHIDRQLVIPAHETALGQIGRAVVTDVERESPRCRVIGVWLEMAGRERVLVQGAVDLAEVDVIERPLDPAENGAVGDDELSELDVDVPAQVPVVESAPAGTVDSDLVGASELDAATHDRINRRAGRGDDVDPVVERVHPAVGRTRLSYGLVDGIRVRRSPNAPRTGCWRSKGLTGQ